MSAALSSLAGESQGWAWFVGETLTKVTLLLLVASLVAWLARRAPAAVRHLTWTVALIGSALLPFSILLAPSWTVGLPLPELAFTPRPTIEPLANELPPGSTSVLPAAATTIPQTSEPLSAWPSLLGLVVWSFGVLLALTRLLIGVTSLRTLLREARPLGDGLVPEEMLDRIGISRAVRLVVSERVTVPLTCGALPPTLVVPDDFETWDDDRRELVLLHELAHVARLDWLTQTLSSVARALYWFHPLAWIAERQLRREAERAADDRVLAAGARASDYAEHLLAIATSLAPKGRQPMAIVSVSGSSLETRLSALLDPDCPHRVASRLTLALAVAGLIAVGPLGALRVAAAAPKVQSSKAVTAPILDSFQPSLRGVVDVRRRPAPDRVGWGSRSPEENHEVTMSWLAALEARPEGEVQVIDWYGLASALVRVEEPELALGVLDRADAIRLQSNTMALRARVEAGLGRHESALKLLEQAVEWGYPSRVSVLERESGWDPIRKEPQFQRLSALVEQLELPEDHEIVWPYDVDLIVDPKVTEPPEGWKAAVVRYRALIAANPGLRLGWFHLGLAALRTGDYGLSASAFQRSVELGQSPRGYSAYHVASAHALAGHGDEAMRWLELAVSSGFLSKRPLSEHWDLKSLRGHAGFQRQAFLDHEAKRLRVMSRQQQGR